MRPSRPPRRPSRPGARPRSRKRTEIMFRIRNLVEQHRKEIAALPDRRARQGPLRRARRGRPRPGEPRVRERHPAPAQGRLQRAGLDRRRRLPDPPAARRRGRHHAVQLPGHGAHVDVRQRHRLRQHVHPQAVGEGPVGIALHGGAARTRPACRTGVFNVIQGDKVAVDRDPRAPRHRGRLASWARRPIARYIYETGTRAGKRVQALGGAKNHMVVLPDADIGHGRRRRGLGRLRLGRRALHGRSAMVVAVGDVADPLVAAIKERLPKVRVGPGQRPDRRDGSAGHAASIATRSRSYLDSGRGPGRDRRRRRARACPLPRVRGLLPGRLAHRPRDARDGRVPQRDLRAGARGRARGDLRRCGQARQRQPVRQRHGHLHPRRGRRAPVPVRRQRRAWSASTCPSRCRSRTTASAAGRPRSSATCTCTAPRASSSTRAPRSSPRAGRTPARPRSTWASRAPAEPARAGPRRRVGGRGAAGRLVDVPPAHAPPAGYSPHGRSEHRASGKPTPERARLGSHRLPLALAAASPCGGIAFGLIGPWRAPAGTS